MSNPPFLARPYRPEDEPAWDDLVLRSTTGNLLHTRRYLSYHADRFDDLSLVVTDSAEVVAAVLPAAADPHDPKTVVSHPGLTYGGLVTERDVTGESMVEALRAVLLAYRTRHLEALVYKVVPTIFHRTVEGDTMHALFRLGAVWARSDLASFVDVAHRSPPKKGRAWAIRKAQQMGIEVSSGRSELQTFWPVVTAVLRDRHGAVPTHSLEEMEHLAALFPDDIECLVARHRGSVVAGAVVYTTPTCLHTQYLASSPEGRDFSALDLIIEAIISKALAGKKRYVSLGTSMEQEGRALNRGLHQYKTSFGASTITFDRYTLRIV
jgi:hypothetical protein